MIYDGIKWSNSKGYWRNNIYGLLHRYIWTQHNGEIPKGYVIHHKNEDKVDNEISNLECMTRSQHIIMHNIGNKYCLGKKHSEETKLKIGLSHKGKIVSEETKCKLSEATKGIKNPKAKLSVLDVKAIKTWLLLGYTQISIAEIFDVSSGCITDIKLGRTWSHINL